MNKSYPLAGQRIWVAGHGGMVGQALVKRLQRADCEILVATRGQLDLRDQAAVARWMIDARPDAIFVAAAKVGGIAANASLPAEFLYENLAIEGNIIHSAYKTGVEKLLFLGSSCIYPKMATQPISEDALLTGPLEPTNEWYAMAKIVGIKLCQAYRRQHGCDFVSAMPTNLYGPGDNYDLQRSHVLPALLSKIEEAYRQRKPYVEIWGTGTPLREFLHVADLADACVYLMERYSDETHVNVGSGEEVTIAELAVLIANVVGYEGQFVFDNAKPDGTPRKLLDCSKLAGLGWTPSISLREGVEMTYRDYVRSQRVAT